MPRFQLPFPWVKGEGDQLDSQAVQGNFEAVRNGLDLALASGGLASGGHGTIVLRETFDTSPLGNYTADLGTSLSGLGITSGELVSSDANDHSCHHNTVTVSEGKVLMQWAPNTGTQTVNCMVKYIDDNNFLMMQADNHYGPSSFQFYQRVGGAYSSLASHAPASLNANQSYFMVTRLGTWHASVEWWSVDPRLGGSPEFNQLVFLPAGLDGSVSGSVGFRLWAHGGGGVTRIQELTVATTSGVDLALF